MEESTNKKRFSGVEIEFLARYAMSGNVSASAQAAGIPRSTAYAILRDPVAQEIIAEYRLRKMKKVGEIIESDRVDHLIFETAMAKRLREYAMQIVDVLTELVGNSGGFDVEFVGLHSRVVALLRSVVDIVRQGVYVRQADSLDVKIRNLEEALEQLTARSENS